MSRQRGYSTVIVGLIFTIIPLPALLVRPVIGVITDKYKCYKLAIILNIVVMSIFISMLMFIPGSVVKTEIDDENVIKSPLFWLFFSTIILLNASVSARTNLEDTICINLLGKNIL
jgi:nitrate/nitrite transporter NarK